MCFLFSVVSICPRRYPTLLVDIRLSSKPETSMDRAASERRHFNRQKITICTLLRLEKPFTRTGPGRTGDAPNETGIYSDSRRYFDRFHSKLCDILW